MYWLRPAEFVTEDRTVYVADPRRQEVFVFDGRRNVINEYGKPDHPCMAMKPISMPLKIAVNHAGIMFVICGRTPTESSDQSGGSGTFLGYFGTNPTSISLINIIIRMFMTDAQRAKMIKNKPPTPDNLAIDDKGLIYTVTRGQGYQTLRRLNIAGQNIMDADQFDDTPAAVCPGNYDNVYMVSNQGYVYEFNNEGNMLFIFGGRDDGRQRIGLSNAWRQLP